MDLRTILIGLALVIAGGLLLSVPIIWWIGVLLIIVGAAVLVLGFFVESSG